MLFLEKIGDCICSKPGEGILKVIEGIKIIKFLHSSSQGAALSSSCNGVLRAYRGFARIGKENRRPRRLMREYRVFTNPEEGRNHHFTLQQTGKREVVDK